MLLADYKKKEFLVNLFPLVVDLDGTLIHSDMLEESLLKTIRKKPLRIFKMPFWLSKGIAVLKEKLAEYADVNPHTLPYNKNFLAWLRKEHEKGRKLILCTGTHHTIAKDISKHLGIFDEVIATDQTVNLTGQAKAKVLVERFGKEAFDYAGNSKKDLAVFKDARRAVVVSDKKRLLQHEILKEKIERVFSPPTSKIKIWGQVLRVHQWLKNSLLFIPIFAAHLFTDLETWVLLSLAFLIFSLSASSIYIVNDLFDLESDREHPRKCKRPFAQGMIPLWKGVLFAFFLSSTSLLLAWQCYGYDFLKCLMAYFLLTLVYSWKLKQIVLLDCIILGCLYTIRIIAGIAVADLDYSFWLLIFSIFLFLSLAFLKRFVELKFTTKQHQVNGRGYVKTDIGFIQNLGITSGYAAIVVLALYLNSPGITDLYPHPEWLLGTIVVMTFWISFMWLQANRGNMPDDPLIFAVKNKVSLLAGLLFFVLIFMGSVGWS